MALQVWLPLNKNLDNLGLCKLKPSGTPTFLEGGKLNKSISLTPRVSFTGLPKLTKFTILFWLKVDSCASDWADSLGFTSKQADGSSAASFRFEATKTSRACSFHNNIPYAITQGSRILITSSQYGEWHHCGFSCDGVNCYTYIDGVKTYTDTGLGGYLIDYFHIGETNNMVGGMNDLRIYDECLSDKQIKEVSKGLVAHYKLSGLFINNRNITLGYYNTNNNSGWGAHRGTAVYTNDEYDSNLPFNKIVKFTVTYDTSLGTGGGTSVYPPVQYNVSGNTTYTYSTYIKAEDNLSYIHANFLYRYEYNSSGTKLIEGGICSSSRKQEIGNGWFRVWGTFTTQTDTVKVSLPFYTYCGKNNIYYLGGEQLELGSSITPYIDETYKLFIDEQDCSGNGYNGVIHNEVIYNSDSPIYQGSYKFNGTNTYITCGRPMPTDEITVTSWVYMDNWSSFQRLCSCTEGGGWNFELISGGINFAVGVGTTSNVYMTNFTSAQLAVSSISSGWHMLTGTFDGINKKIYLDGVLKGSLNTLQNNTTLTTKTPIFYNKNNGLFIGCEAQGTQTTPASPYFNGSISDFRIYSKALTETEIKELYYTRASIDNLGNIYAYEFEEV